jgi:hypothetical protein
MATSIAFGLGVSALLVLFFVPALLSLLESFKQWSAALLGLSAKPAEQE